MEDELSLTKLKITKPRRVLLESIGILTIDDLIHYYPYRYDFFERTLPTITDDKIVIDGVVLNSPRLIYQRGNQSKMIFDMVIDGKVYNISIFNRHFLRIHLKVGKEVTVIGKCQYLSNKIIAGDIKLNNLKELSSIVPIYSSKEGITTKTIHQYVLKALIYQKGKIETFIPSDYVERYRLVSKEESVFFVHSPRNKQDIKQALRHLKYEEFLKFQLVMQYLNIYAIKDTGIKKEFDQKNINRFIAGLPFELTNDQLKTVKEIIVDLKSFNLMHRLVQGDVGSGKTIVACIGLYANYLAGYQGALMAPTELLALQHVESIKKIFKNFNLRIELLTGSMSTKEKKDIYNRLENNAIDILIGTHALIQEKVVFHNLGLVIADEQHRFGVKQRQILKAKGNKVDFLLMSATPIPRTLAISLFGDMAVSTIKTMPEGRIPNITKFYKSSSLKPVLSFFNQYLIDGGQCYVVCPLVEESENLDLRDATKIYEGMKQYYKDKFEVGLLHGRMKDEEKEEIMELFRKNKIQILVSTTVIEVGVDVANANVMVIYNADRFGLSQLHQLRGRVGRGNQQGYCFLLSNIDNEDSINRVKFLETTNDGFEISTYDLKLRGPGEVLGSKQSGIPTFMIADVFEDYQILEKARQDAIQIVSSLEKYPMIEAYILKKLAEGQNILD